MWRPLFRRPDGDLIENESNVRQMIPFLMLGRNESVVLHDEMIDLTRTKPWIKEYNRHHTDMPITLFHLMLWAMGRGFHMRAGMNRFVSGKRLYQRKGVQISFAAKKKFREEAPLVTIKMPFEKDEPFEATLTKLREALGEGRSERQSITDKELKLALALPTPMLSGVMALLRWLDRVNLMPKAMIDTDPMYASCFFANLGSVGIDRTYHHLYEYGTVSLFAVMGVPRKHVVVGSDGQPAVKEMVEVRWSFDERINDGFYCAASLRAFARLVEDPEKYIGKPDAVRVPAPAEAAPAA